MSNLKATLIALAVAVAAFVFMVRGGLLWLVCIVVLLSPLILFLEMR
jgi:hypothetical protein